MEFLKMSPLLIVTMVISMPAQSLILPSFSAGAYQYPLAAVETELPEHLQLATYQNGYSPYIIYDVLGMHTDLKHTATAVFADGKPTVQRIPTYSYGYYGTPVYDFRLPLPPVYSVLRPSRPTGIPRPTSPPMPPTTPSDVEDGIETLDQKVQPESEKKETEGGEEMSLENDDTVAVDSI